MIRHLVARRQQAARDADLRILPGEEPLEPQSVVHRHVDDATDGGGAIEIDGLTGDPLEEVAAETVPDEGRNLDRLRRGARRIAGENQREDRQAAGHGWQTV